MNTLLLFMKKSNVGIVLSIGSCVGTIGAVIFAIRATPKAEKIYKCMTKNNKSMSEVVLEMVPIYTPSFICAVASITCSLYQAILFRKTEQLWINAYGTLLSACIPMLRDNKNTSYIHSEPTPEDEILYFDEISGSYFYSTPHKVEEAIVSINKELNTYGFATIRSFASILNIPLSDNLYGLGWASEELYETTGSSWISIIPTTTIIGPDLSCEALMFLTPPTDDYGPF